MTSPLHFSGAKAGAITSRFSFLSLLVGAAMLVGLTAGPADAQTRTKSMPIRSGSGAFDITAGADGNFWFTLSNGTQVGRVTPKGQITTFRTPSLSNPAFMTLGPDGNVWFGEGSTGRIAFITPAGQITELQFSFFGVSVGITTGSDGNIWFSDQTDHAIWRYDLSTVIFTEFKTPTPSSFPGDMTLGADGNVWFTEQAAGKFAKITPAGEITEFTGVDSPSSIAAGPDGNLWISSAFTANISRVTTAGAITVFPVPHTPSIIRPGAGDNLLFTSFTGNTIASITTDGVVTESLPFPNSAPLGIAAGKRGQVWFLGNGSNRVYRTIFP
jgi:virginiamycin B lyase